MRFFTNIVVSNFRPHSVYALRGSNSQYKVSQGSYHAPSRECNDKDDLQCQYVHKGEGFGTASNDGLDACFMRDVRRGVHHNFSLTASGFDILDAIQVANGDLHGGILGY